ncbi:MAG: Crp/Fnr family transcriptional regulator [Acidimicrobiales bacterium]
MPVRKGVDQRQKVEVLGRLALFEDCSKQELERVAEVSVETTLKQGTILTHKGKVGGLVYVVLDGEAEVTSGDQRIGTVGPGDVAGELSLIDGQPRSAEVRATSDMRVLEINVDDFRQLMEKAPRFVQSMMRALAARIRDANEHLPVDDS